MYGDLPESNAPERILVLKVIDGEKPKTSTGTVDSRLFKGENNLRAIRDRQSNLWFFKYDVGGIPEQLKGTWTKFEWAYKVAEDYFKARNIEIAEVIRK